MNIKESIVLFENVELRKVELKKENWIPAVDVAKALNYKKQGYMVVKRNNKYFVFNQNVKVERNGKC